MQQRLSSDLDTAPLYLVHPPLPNVANIIYKEIDIKFDILFSRKKFPVLRG